MTRFELSRSAVSDVQAIRRYTRERFGVQQAVRLRQRLLSAFRKLASNPELGSLRPEYSPKGREFRYWPLMGAFVLVYEPFGDGIRVARVVHGARDMIAELELDAGDDSE